MIIPACRPRYSTWSRSCSSFTTSQTKKPSSASALICDDRNAPAAFLIDEEGLIRRVYEPGTALPNPAALLRAIGTIAQAPKPPRVTEKDWRLGPPRAPVLLVEYADYQCGHCQELYQVMRRVLSLYPDRVGLVFRHFPLRHSHPLAQLAAEAAEAAGAQGRFWEMHERLFEAKNALEREHLIAYAGEIGLDVTKFDEDLATGAFRTAVEEDLRGAMGNRIKFPPTLFINGILYDGARTPDAIAARIEVLLACLGIENSRLEMKEER